MKPSLSKQEQINQGVEDIRNCLLEKIEAGNAVLKAGLREKRAYYNLMKAKERMYAIERDMTGEFTLDIEAPSEYKVMRKKLLTNE